MFRRWLALGTSAVLLLAACGSGASPSPSTAPVGSAPASSAPASSGGSSGAPGASGAPASSGQGGTGSFDASSVSGDITLAGWSAAGSTEEKALQSVLNSFMQKYPKIKVTFQPVAGDYPTSMVAKFSAHQPPDLFYVDSSYAQDWIQQGVLYNLSPWIQGRGFSTSAFYPGYLKAFTGPNGNVYGIPKDANTLGMAYNPTMLTKAGISSPPTTLDELMSDAAKIKAAGMMPMCLSLDLARAAAFIYADGGSLFTNGNKSEGIDQPAAVKGVQYYLNLFKQGYGQSPSALGVDWCGHALGEQKAAIIFEGAWLDPYMQSTYPKVSYKWADFPKGTQQATLGFTVSYSIGVDSPNKDAAWVLMTYLTGPTGMQQWTQGGIGNPSRKDVQGLAANKLLIDQGQYAVPWAFVPGFTAKVYPAFNNALTAAVQKNGSAQDIISATKAAEQQVLAGGS